MILPCVTDSRPEGFAETVFPAQSCLIVLFFLALPMLLPAQRDTLNQSWHSADNKKPTADAVLLQVNVFNLNRRKMANVDVRMLDTGSGRVWRGKSGSFGEVLFLLPKGREYRIDAGSELGITTLRLSAEPYIRESVDITWLPDRFTEEERRDTVYQTVSAAQTPTRSRVLVQLTILDLDDRPLVKEEMYFTAGNTGKVYLARTDQQGKAYLMLPMGDKYCLGSRVEPLLKCYDLPREDKAAQLNIRFNTIGAEAIARRRAERARQAAIRDSLYRIERIRDSISAGRRLRQEENFVHQLLFGGSKAEIEKRVALRAAEERAALKEDPLYFEKSGEAVKAVLYRMRDRWKHKVIVTDLTGSMSPYMDQVILWHALQLVQEEENQYVFFNDGDNRPDAEKEIGRTGGVYGIGRCTLDELLSSMAQTAGAGSGGDSPENDVEALLSGAGRLGGLDELILVADNYSDVRDLTLLEQLKVPVHVILCGSVYGPNEEYLELAFRTHGTVHTVEQDIEDLATLADGATIEIGGFRYRVSRGKFIRVTRI